MKEVYTAVSTKEAEKSALPEAKAVPVKNTEERGARRMCSLPVRIAAVAAVAIFLVVAMCVGCAHKREEENTVSSSFLRAGNGEPKKPCNHHHAKSGDMRPEAMGHGDFPGPPSPPFDPQGPPPHPEGMMSHGHGMMSHGHGIMVPPPPPQGMMEPSMMEPGMMEPGMMEPGMNHGMMGSGMNHGMMGPGMHHGMMGGPPPPPPMEGSPDSDEEELEKPGFWSWLGFSSSTSSSSSSSGESMDSDDEWEGEGPDYGAPETAMAAYGVVAGSEDSWDEEELVDSSVDDQLPSGAAWDEGVSMLVDETEEGVQSEDIAEMEEEELEQSEDNSEMEEEEEEVNFLEENEAIETVERVELP